MAEHWCKEHQTVFFKKGGMKGYAHPIVDENGESTGKWCNEPKEQTQTVGLKADISQRFNRGKSEEELELSRRSFALSYAKDLLVAHELDKENILIIAQEFYEWLKGAIPKSLEGSPSSAIEQKLSSPSNGEEKEIFETKPATQPQMKKIMELNQKHPGKAKELIKEWGWDVKDVTKLSRNQARYLIEGLEKLPENKELPFD